MIEFNIFDYFLNIIGFISSTFIVITVTIRAFIYFRSKAISLNGRPNAWAVITGATDGIGLEYARQLSQKKYNLLLLSRCQTKLIRVKTDIESQTDCMVRVLAVDFRRTDIYERIAKELNKLEEIHILVNNVGLANPKARPEYFTKLPCQYLNYLINVNIVSSTLMTELVLPRMEKKGQGIIINIASGAALHPVPFGAVYSASKAYVDFMSRALSKEYESKGITIQSVLPFYVSTKMINDVKPMGFIASPQQFVSSALKRLGKSERTSGYPMHRIQYIFVELLNILSKFIGIDLNVVINYNVMQKMYSKYNYTKID